MKTIKEGFATGLARVNLSLFRGVTMTDFDRKVEDATDRLNRSVANIAATLEKETAELVTYLNDEVVPAARTHSSKALRVASEKLSRFAEYLETHHKNS